MTLSLTEEKVKGILQKCKIICSMKEIGFAVTTISRSSIIHHTSSSSSSHSILLPAASTSVSPERKNVFQRKNYSKQSAAGRTAVRIGNLKYFNERYMIQGKPQIVIQTVASLGA